MSGRPRGEQRKEGLFGLSLVRSLRSGVNKQTNSRKNSDLHCIWQKGAVTKQRNIHQEIGLNKYRTKFLTYSTTSKKLGIKVFKSGQRSRRHLRNARVSPHSSNHTLLLPRLRKTRRLLCRQIITHRNRQGLSDVHSLHHISNHPLVHSVHPSDVVMST